jgi:hypothetical protein
VPLIEAGQSSVQVFAINCDGYSGVVKEVYIEKTDPSSMEWYLREVELLEKLRHAHVVEFHGGWEG